MFYRAVLVILGVVVLFSCTDEIRDDSCINPENVEVGFYLDGNRTRTSMLSDGLSAEWLPSDKISVWAKGPDGTFELENQIFGLYGLDVERGFFTSTLSSPMPDGVYTYYCSYPSPESVKGTQAVFTLPSVQNGKVADGADIMIATTVQHGPLTSVKDLDSHSRMYVSMNRMMHQFRFYVPENNLVMQSEKITKIELGFPGNVCGKVMLDLADPEQKAVLSDAGSKVILQLDEPLGISSESKGVYEFACAAIVPSEFAAGEKLSLRAFTDEKIAVIEPVDLKGKSFKPGHSTPVRLVVKELVEYPYQIRFTLSGNNVGESVTSVKFVAPNGCRWPLSGTNEYVYAPGKEIQVGETVTFRFADYNEYAAFSSKNVSIVLETENAISTSSVTVAAIPSNVQSHASSISASMPYLLYQDFTSVSTYNDGHDNPTVGTSSDTYKGITELSSAGLPGWYGTRVGVQKGASARICCRYEHVLLAGAYYKGRLYTPQLSMLKEGHNVKISVSYKYGSNRSERDPLFGSKPDKSPVLYFGVNTQDVVTNPDENEGGIIDQITGLYAGSGYASSTPTSLSPMVIKGEYLDKANGSYTSLPKSKSVTVENVDRYMRLAWILTTDNTASNTNANYWFYIDEIKVKIIK